MWSRCGLAFRTLVCVTRLSEAELDAMVQEATVDCYDEEEQLTGLATMVEENLEVPFETTVLGVTVTVTGVTHTSHGLVADCARGRHRQAVHLLDLPLPDLSPKGAEWIVAYRRWAR
jgi:Calcium binding